MKVYKNFIFKSKINNTIESEALFSDIKRKRVKRRVINNIISEAIMKLSLSKTRSLITFECNKNLDLRIKEEIIVNNDITVENILQIFDKNNCNNDSPIIIKNSLIKSIGVIYNSRDSIKDHAYFTKTGIYLSEVSDSVSILTTTKGEIKAFYKGSSKFLTDSKQISRLLNKNTRIRFKSIDNIVYNDITSVVSAIEELSVLKNGAFISIEGHLPLFKYVKEYSKIDMSLSKETLVHLFNPNNNYSEGGTILRGSRIAYANVGYNVEQVPKSSDESRLTSAKYLSKVTDTTSFLVAEKTGQISLIKAGIITEITNTKEIYFILSKGYKYLPEKKAFTYSKLSQNEFADTLLELSKLKRGALVSIKRNDSLNEYINNAIKIDTVFSKELLMNIFINYTPLHDGAVIMNGNSIRCAGAYYPLGNFKNIDKTTGSRHRAAIGISQKTDALTFIVSEETGIISLTIDGKMKRFLTKDDILENIDKYLREVSS